MNSADTVRTARIVIGNSIADMAKVADLVDRFGEEHAIPQRAIINMNVCLDELLNNTISYGYADQNAHDITVELSLTGDKSLSAEISDDAAPFDPREAPPPSFEGAIGGLGVHFVRTLMDEIAYARVGNRNVVKITKRLTPEVDESR